MKLKTVFTFVLVFILSSVFSQNRKSALFLGNSFTYANNMPEMVSKIALSLGDTLVYESNTPGGYTLEGHSTNSTTLSKISSNNWDFVTLQEQSQRPSLPPEEVEELVFPFAEILNDSIKSNDTCTTTMFFMSWGYKNGDPTNCDEYPPVCTYAGMQERIRETYLEMTVMFDASVAPIGAAWQIVRETDPEIELYSSDEHHPSLSGSYLIACVFYSSFFHKSPVGAYYPFEIAGEDALTIQTIVQDVVMNADSLLLWNIDTTTVAANFDYTETEWNQIDFTNTSLNANSYLWDFDDGTYSTEPNTSHIFAAEGTYYVCLKSNNGCKADSIVKVVNIVPTNINKTDKKEINIFPNPAGNFININLTPFSNFENSKLNIYNSSMICIYSAKISENNNKINLSQFEEGVYFIKIITEQKVFLQQLIIQY